MLAFTFHWSTTSSATKGGAPCGATLTLHLFIPFCGQPNQALPILSGAPCGCNSDPSDRSLGRPSKRSTPLSGAPCGCSSDLSYSSLGQALTFHLFMPFCGTPNQALPTLPGAPCGCSSEPSYHTLTRLTKRFPTMSGAPCGYSSDLSSFHIVLCSTRSSASHFVRCTMWVRL